MVFFFIIFISQQNVFVIWIMIFLIALLSVKSDVSSNELRSFTSTSNVYAFALRVLFIIITVKFKWKQWLYVTKAVRAERSTQQLVVYCFLLYALFSLLPWLNLVVCLCSISVTKWGHVKMYSWNYVTSSVVRIIAF